MLDLSNLLDKINNWLKFSEAKNGAIIALNSGLIFGIIKISTSVDIKYNIVLYYIYFLIFILLLSFIMALLSFLPRYVTPFIDYGKPNDEDNILFFSDIAKYTTQTYTKKINKLYKQEFKQVENFYIQSIVENSKITVIKLNQFELALWLLLSTIITPLGCILIFVLRKNKII